MAELKPCPVLRWPVRYAERNTHQCWTCKNRVGQIEQVISVMDADSIQRKIVFLLPECRVVGSGMLWVNECPCPKYICSYGERKGGGE